MPRVMGFGEDSESKFFTMQSMLRTAVTAMSDFGHDERDASDRLGNDDEEGVA
jgi:hypothetical protein